MQEIPVRPDLSSAYPPIPGREWAAFRVTHRTDEISWTVIDAATYDPHPEASRYLHYLLGSARSVNTIRAYAQRLAAFFTWTEAVRLDWTGGMPVASRFIRELAAAPLPDRSAQAGYNDPRYRSGKTLNHYAVAVTQFYMWAARSDLISEKTAAGFYETRIAYGLARTGAQLLPGQQIKARAVRVREVEESPRWLERAGSDALLSQLGNHRDRFLVTLMLETGVRIGEALGLRTEDLHLFQDSRAVGCPSTGPHVHVRRRRNPNDALVKSSRPRSIPVTEEACFLYHVYLGDRIDRLTVDESPMVFVNLYSPRNPGGAVRYSNAVKMFYRCARKAGLKANPHMLRHTAATRWKRAGVPATDIQELLGHRSAASQEVYEHASDEDLRAAVESVRSGPAAGHGTR